MKSVATVKFAVVLAVLSSLWAAPATADLYRWVDPESGSVKFSSYPPPWFGDAAKQGRAPKVEVIAPMKTAPAFEPGANPEREPAATPSERSNPAARAASGDSAKEGSASAAESPRSDRRDGLLKLIAQRVAALISAAPETTERAFSELSEPLRELEQLDRQSKSNPKDEAARLDEKWQLAVPLEAHRVALMQRIAALQPPPPGSAPELAANAWRGTQRQLSALEWTNEAIKAIDPRKLNARHFEMRALTEKVAAVWEPYIDADPARRDRGR